jgi:hypothetical protein
MGKIILTKKVIAGIPALVEAGMTRQEIAAKLGCKISTLQVRCCKEGVRLRKLPRPKWRLPRTATALTLSSDAMETMAHWAASRGCSETNIASRLLEVIARDNLYDAVLDDRRLFHKEFEP